MIIRNEDISEVIAEIPGKHKHIRTTLKLQSGEEITFEEAAIANIVRAYISIKTHPVNERIVLKGRMLDKRKDGYANWQLLEV